MIEWGSYDGDAVIILGSRALSHINGAWREIHAAKAGRSIALSEKRFAAMFGHIVNPLPVYA